VGRLEAQFDARFAEIMVAIQATEEKKKKNTTQAKGSSNSTHPLQSTTQEASHLIQHELIPIKPK